MSGPKSTRYTLTPEQRRILAEARERERKTKREWDKLQQYRSNLVSIQDKLNTAAKNVNMLVERIGMGEKDQVHINDSLMQIQKAIQDTGAMNSLSGLEKLQAINTKVYTVLQNAKIVGKTYENQSDEIAKNLSIDIENSISAGMMLRVDAEIDKPLDYMEAKRKKILEAISSAMKLNINDGLRQESMEINKKAQEINNGSFLDNYYAMTVLPFVKKCKRYNEQFAERGEEFEELVSKHRYYSEYLGFPVTQFSFSIDKIEALKQEISQLKDQCERLEEQRYISESLDEVMSDMGYHVVGNREVAKRNGRKFRNELYHFSEGTVVNITYAANGQISMELGGVDTCDREPSEEESTALCDDMCEFCSDFQEIEKRLREKGVVWANRISMLPPVEEYAQIINVSDYKMVEQVDNIEIASRKQGENKKQLIRRE